MRLEVRRHPVEEVRFGEATRLEGKTLLVNRAELRQALGPEPCFGKLEIELARPGQSCRITFVADVVEPRAKVPGKAPAPLGDSQDFPGVLGPMGIAGTGATAVLQGVAVVESGAVPRSSALLDMSGPGTAYTPFAHTQNLVLLTEPAAGVDPTAYGRAVKLAGLKAAVFLAQTARDLQPSQTEVYELPPLPEVLSRWGHLPKVAYLYLVNSFHSGPLDPNEPFVYGTSGRGILPTLLHPNEVIDGALANGYRALGIYNTLYSIQNHPVVTELYRRHGTELCFLGVILYMAPVTMEDKVRCATYATNLVRSLGVEGLVFTKVGGGAPDTDLMTMCQQCEEAGIRTVILALEMSGDGNSDAALTLYTPGADAITSAGSTHEILRLPAVERVLGPRTIPYFLGRPGDVMDAQGPVDVHLNDLCGATSPLGLTRLSTVEV